MDGSRIGAYCTPELCEVAFWIGFDGRRLTANKERILFGYFLFDEVVATAEDDEEIRGTLSVIDLKVEVFPYPFTARALAK